jgi:hypothetical protein
MLLDNLVIAFFLIYSFMSILFSITLVMEILEKRKNRLPKNVKILDNRPTYDYVSRFRK